ncbi:hypothetical protein FV242_31935 [Methylobacterium sp. WL64]|uniref:hypothetical protein n=1 Tax=Methylobacterium sp. WL64 TaxID=2603894 RepID=UPI0011CC9D9A|nr:hypothetical protein [Methylobacterium sp. WL64]TXM97283.1 hypothetical protein FV242_31935 [Methylobacterium sp. WL64]
MAIALAEQVLQAQASGQPFDEKQLEALAVAARFLLENEISWPPVVEKAIDVLASHLGKVKAASTVVEP